ncbi:MAG: hypothetical protein V3U99_05140, partial [Alphaproteobacteria bacterium]
VIDESIGVLAPFDRRESRHLGEVYFVNVLELERCIDEVLAMGADAKADMGQAARLRVEENDRRFRARLSAFFART